MDMSIQRKKLCAAAPLPSTGGERLRRRLRMSWTFKVDSTRKIKTNAVNWKYIITALLTTLCSSACTSDEELPQSFVRQDGMVKTQFNISVATSGHDTRMGDDELQWGQTLSAFRGMESIVVKPFSAWPVKQTDTPLGPDLTLERMVKPVEYDQQANYIPAGSEYLLTGSHSALYEDVDVPNGTNAFLFYGKAIADPQTDAEKHRYGVLTPTAIDDTPARNTFRLSQINPEAKLDDEGYALHIADYLTQIANSRNGSNEAWSEAPTLVVRDLYNSFTGNTPTGNTPTGIKPLAGSTRNAQAVVQELYTSSLENSELAGYVQAAILNAYAYDDTSKKYVTGVDDSGNLIFNASLLGDISTTDYFPANVGLPDGAAALAWNTTDSRFDMVRTFSDAMGYTPTLNTTDMAFFVYPPALWYFANTPVMTSSSEQRDNYTADKTWDEIRSLYQDQGVGANSKSVIMKQQVQYAVACLEVKVKCASATLKDQQDADVRYNDGGFPITAVLAGTQRHAAFDFTPGGTDSYTLYDNIVPTAFKASATNNFDTMTPSRTLVMESEPGEALNIVVEFVNNSGHDFYGHEGDLISKGCKFYLIAKLDPAVNTTEADPNYKEQDPETPWGTTTPEQLINHVFKQDHVTQALLTIQDLKNAYNLVPDLRLPKLDLGLYVNLEWQTGIEMGTVEIGSNP